MNHMEKGKMLWPSLDNFLDDKPVIINPVSGKDSIKVARYLPERLKDKNFLYYLTREKGDGAKFLSEKIAAAEKADKMLMVLVVGGDGTCNELINANGDLSRVVWVIIPAGTGKDMARSLNMTNINNTCKVLNQVSAGKASLEDYVKCIDLIKASYDDGKEVKANYLCSLGFDGVVCKEVNSSRRKGGFKDKNIYFTKTIHVLRENKYEPIKINYTINNDPATAKELDDVLMFTIMSGRYAGSGMNYNPEYSLSDGLLEGFLVKSLTLGEVSRLFWHVWWKKDNEHIVAERDTDGFNRFKINYMPGIQSAVINLLDIKSNIEYYLNTDGEPHLVEKPSAPIKVDVLKCATYMLYMPKKEHGCRK